MSQEQKHTLFYSNHCGHSKDAMTLIASRGVRDRFVLICVEQYASALPRFVDCVPLLYTSNAEILTDEDLLLFLQNIRPNNTNKAAMVADVVDPTASELSAFDLSSSGGSAGLSDSFSFIDSSNEQQHQKPRGYIYISSPPTQPRPLPQPLFHATSTAAFRNQSKPDDKQATSRPIWIVSRRRGTMKYLVSRAHPGCFKSRHKGIR